jgi:hypothetical protein
LLSEAFELRRSSLAGRGCQRAAYEKAISW